MLSEKTQIILIWLTLVFGIIYWIGYAYFLGFFPPPEPLMDTESVLALYSAENVKFRIGVVLMLISGGFAVPWTTVIAIQMARLETGVPAWSILQFASGVLGSIFNVAPPLIWGVAAFSVERAPEITLIMHEFAFLTFFTPVSWFIIQAVPIGVVSLTQKPVEHSAFPRWIGFCSLWFALIAECGVMAQIFKQGPFAWNGLFVFWLPLCGFLVYISAICYCMLTAINRQRASHFEIGEYA